MDLEEREKRVSEVHPSFAAIDKNRDAYDMTLFSHDFVDHVPHRTAGGQNIVYDKHLLAWPNVEAPAKGPTVLRALGEYRPDAKASGNFVAYDNAPGRGGGNYLDAAITKMLGNRRTE